MSLEVMREKLRAMGVVARRDFMTVVFSKGFVLFLLGPLFMVLVGTMAGGIGTAAQAVDRPVIGLAMSGPDTDAMLAARAALADRMAGGVPDFTVIRRLAPGETADGTAAMRQGKGQLAAVLTGTPAAPRFTTTRERAGEWQGMIETIAREAAAPRGDFPEVKTVLVATSAAKQSSGKLATAQTGQMLLFLLTMLLATMVLSNLVEEKSNKIIEILAAAIPMDALFMGKLFAMLAVSFVGVGVWGVGLGAVMLAGAKSVPVLATPALGWAGFAVLGIVYFAMAYLLLGSVYLAIGGIAATVRDIQTLALPASLLQVAMIGFANYALMRPGTPVEWAATVFPLSSPYMMIAAAALDGRIWPHLVAIAWQGGFVLLFITLGARLFRRTVMKSGPAPTRRTSPWQRAKPA